MKMHLQSQFPRLSAGLERKNINSSVNEKDLDQTQTFQGGIALVLALGSLFFNQIYLTLSILLGFFLVWANFWLLRKLVAGLLHKNIGRTRLFLIFIVKYIGLMGLLGGSIIYFDLHLIGLLIGVSSLMVAVVAVSMKRLFAS